MPQIPPVNQYRFEREFYEELQRPENRGFNARFAEELNLRDDGDVSRMHNPNVPERPSWLYKAADKLDKACRVNLGVARKALSMLAQVVARHEGAGEFRPEGADRSLIPLMSKFQEALVSNALRGDVTEADIADAWLRLRTVGDAYVAGLRQEEGALRGTAAPRSAQ